MIFLFDPGSGHMLDKKHSTGQQNKRTPWYVPQVVPHLILYPVPKPKRFGAIGGTFLLCHGELMPAFTEEGRLHLLFLFFC